MPVGSRQLSVYRSCLDVTMIRYQWVHRVCHQSAVGVRTTSEMEGGRIEIVSHVVDGQKDVSRGFNGPATEQLDIDTVQCGCTGAIAIGTSSTININQCHDVTVESTGFLIGYGPHSSRESKWTGSFWETVWTYDTLIRVHPYCM